MTSHSFASEPPRVTGLESFFRPYPNIRLTRGDLDSYRQLRAREPQLVSIADEGKLEGEAEFDVLTLFDRQTPMGAASYAVQTNRVKTSRANRFARIDLVMAAEEYRGLGVGRLLLVCVCAHLLRAYESDLYSISCLAAHPAVDKVLKQLSFAGEERSHLNYTHQELRLEGVDVAALAARYGELAAEASKAAAYHLRQRQGRP